MRYVTYSYADPEHAFVLATAGTFEEACQQAVDGGWQGYCYRTFADGRQEPPVVIGNFA